MKTLEGGFKENANVLMLRFNLKERVDIDGFG